MLAEATPAPAQTEATLDDLMHRYQCADERAAAELIRQVSPALLRFLSRPGWTRSEAEDLLQECWLRIHKARHTYRPGEPVLPWIFAIARHTRVDGLRRRGRIESHELGGQEMGEIAAPAREPTGPDIFGLLEELPESQREVVLMLKVTGMSLEEVARATSSTVGAVKQKAHRAYEKLRSRLSGLQAGK